jgi:prolyl 4-hydroxylase
VIMYLSDVEAGGATRFHELSLEFTPLKGAALLFTSIARDRALLQTSLHSGCPVTSGEKWIATKWIRVAPHARAERKQGAKGKELRTPEG